MGTIWLWIGLVTLGFSAGAYGVAVGAGGGFVIAPLLMLLFRIEPRIAVGTTLSVVFLNGVSGTIAYARQRRVDYRSGILLGIAAVPGSVIGTYVFDAVPGDLFRALFGILLVLLAIWILVRPVGTTSRSPSAKKNPSSNAVTRQMVTRDGEVYRYSFKEWQAMGLNGMFGFLSSLFGIGGGWLRVPMLVYVFNFPVMIATATSTFALIIYTGVGALAHYRSGNFSFSLAIAVGLGVVLGAQMGAGLSRKIRNEWILRFLAIAILVLGVGLILQGSGE